MKIIHLTAGILQEGAAKGALRLHQGLLDLGIDSHIVGDNRANEPIKNLIDMNTFMTKVRRKINYKWNQFQLRDYPNRVGLFSVGNDWFSLYKHIDFSNYDLIHLHWVNYAISIKSIRQLSQKHRVLWTIRDMWPFTGGCHYSLDCQSYTTGCGGCPLLQSPTETLTSRQLLKKQKSFQRIEFVGISDWIKEQAIASGVASPTQIHRVYNSVDTQRFVRYSKSEIESLRQQYGLNTSRKILISGAQNVLDPYKGPDELRKFIATYKDEYFFILFGRGVDELVAGIEGVQFLNVGFVNESKLCDLFNIADIFLMFSKQEGFGKTIIESLVCGTPVICLPGSAPAEIINSLPSSCGFVWNQSDDMRSIIQRLAATAESLPIDTVQTHFSNTTIAAEYAAVYQQCIS